MMFASDLIHTAFTLGSWPATTLATVMKDRSSSTLGDMGHATSTVVEGGLVIWVRVKAIWFPIAESRSRGMGGSGCGGGGGWSGGAVKVRFWSSGWGWCGKVWKTKFKFMFI